MKPQSLLPGYWFANVTGKSIRGGFCEPSKGECYWYIDGRIAFDHEKCFDKWSKCPYSLELPKTEREYAYMLDRMAYMQTEEGFKKSNEFDLWIRDYPFSIHILCPACHGSKKVMGKRKLKMRPKDISGANIYRKASGLDPNKDLPQYRHVYIKCPKCKGKGKIKRPKNGT